MKFTTGDAVSVVNGPFKGRRDCFVQRAAIPEDNFAGLDRTGQYLVNVGNAAFVVGWEAGFWVNPEDIELPLTVDEREFLGRLLNYPLWGEFEEYLKTESAAAFSVFKAHSLIDLWVIDGCFHVTNKGRAALGFDPDPQID